MYTLYGGMCLPPYFFCHNTLFFKKNIVLWQVCHNTLLFESQHVILKKKYCVADMAHNTVLKQL